jgi:hypothetical protein
VYVVDAVDADADCGDEFRCALIAVCDMAFGTYVEVDVMGSDPTPAVDE